MIRTITMSPVVDKSAGSAKFSPAKKMRGCNWCIETDGGINASKALKNWVVKAAHFFQAAITENC